MSHRPEFAVHELRFAHVASGARIAWARSGRAGRSGSSGRSGQTSAPVLVRVAHWMTHLEYDLRSPIWQPWLERLGGSFDLVRYDERGCGLSGADAVELGIDAAVEELEVVVDAAVGVDGRAAAGDTRGAHPTRRVALLGISGAAATAVAYAARHPERVSHLVLLGSYARGLLRREPSADARAYFEATMRMIELGWGRANSPVQAYFTATMQPECSAAEAAAMNEQQRLSCDGQRAARIARARAMLDVVDLASRVRTPTLVLHGSGDGTVSPESGRELAALIPGARFETLPTRNHVPSTGTPAFDRFVQVMSDFVLGASTPRPTLTPREIELLRHVAAGLDNLQIAAQMTIAQKTARNALSLLYRKLGVEGRPQAIVRARDILGE